jgi:hypothetical protein
MKQASFKKWCIGVDGEGYEHGQVYAYMAAASTSTVVGTTEQIGGLSTADTLDFLLSLPHDALKFGFSLGYDYTKILQDLPNRDLWLLCRPEERQDEQGPPTPIYYISPETKTREAKKYELNLLGGRMSIRDYSSHTRECPGFREGDPDLPCPGCKGGKRVILWDVFKFFQSSFVKACLDWNVITAEEFEILAEMKKKRPDFRKPAATIIKGEKRISSEGIIQEPDRIVSASEHPEWLEIKRYCQLECKKMADLAERLLQAHEDASLKLRQYYGAGSTGAAMLEKMNARRYIRLQYVPRIEVERKKNMTPLERLIHKPPTGKAKGIDDGQKNERGEIIDDGKWDEKKYVQAPTGYTGKVLWRRIEYHPHLLYAIACAFFGGRFEISRYGPLAIPCHSYDISSAYPYAFTFLPCLVHGKWRHVTCGTTSAMKNAPSSIAKSPRDKTIKRLSEEWLHDEIVKAQHAIVHYNLPWTSDIGPIKDDTSELFWGPFPFRMGKGQEPLIHPGDIVFPVTSGGGWVCKEEYLVGRAFAPNVVPVEAWIYETSCECKVLRHVMPENYKLRCSWGKEGKGQVAKLGQNSCYGKAAQTKGKQPPYQEFVWALFTTGSCRAQLLRAMTGLVLNADERSKTFGQPTGKIDMSVRESVVMLATDGIVSTKALDTETPKDTGTFDTIDIKSGKKKPLGGWEYKSMPNGVFLIRPGIAFPLGLEKLDEKAQKKAEADFKARGIGKHVLRGLRQDVMTNWEESGAKDMKTEKQLFHGMKSCVYVTPKSPAHPEGEYRRAERFGKFGMQPQAISYKPTPKRPAARGGRGPDTNVFLTWALGQEHMSIPYGPILGKPRIISPLQQTILDERLQNEDSDGLDVANDIEEFKDQ